MAMADHQLPEQHDRRVLALRGGLLVVWALAGFGFFFFARDLQFVVAGWPFAYWMGAQGAILVFIAILAVYATLMRRLAPQDSERDADPPHG
jgi:putative solute:sodium symporter small subunit